MAWEKVGITPRQPLQVWVWDGTAAMVEMLTDGLDPVETTRALNLLGNVPVGFFVERIGSMLLTYHPDGWKKTRRKPWPTPAELVAELLAASPNVAWSYEGLLTELAPKIRAKNQLDAVTRACGALTRDPNSGVRRVSPGVYQYSGD